METKKWIKRPQNYTSAALFSLLLMFGFVQVNAQGCGLACEAQTIISLGEEGITKINPTVFLAHECAGDFTVKIVGENNTLAFTTTISSNGSSSSAAAWWDIDADTACPQYEVIIEGTSGTNTGNSCWGTVEIIGAKGCSSGTDKEEPFESVPPIAICIERATAVLDNGTVTIWAQDLDHGSYDNQTAAHKLEFSIYRMDNCCNGACTQIPSETVTFCESDIDVTNIIIMRVTDASGNYNECMTEIIIADGSVDPDNDAPDLHAPTPYCHSQLSIALTDDGIAKLYASSLDNGSFDDKTQAHKLLFSAKRSDSCCFDDCNDFTDAVAFCKDDLDQTFEVIMKVTDESGKSDICYVAVTVVDKLDDGHDDPPFNDECSGIVADLTKLDIETDIFYAAISMEDLQEILVKSYDDALSALIESTYGDENGGLIGYAFHDEIFEGGEEDEFDIKIIRTLQFIDWCHFNSINDNGFVTIIQTIVIANLREVLISDIYSSSGAPIPVSSLTISNPAGITAIPSYDCAEDFATMLSCSLTEQEWESPEFSLDIAKIADCLNGVSTLDIVLVQKHILDIKRFDANHKYVAADVNKDGKISAGDLVKMRKLILGLDVCQDQMSSWSFHKASLLDDESFSLSELSKYELNYNADDLTSSEANIVGVKRADINSSSTANVASSDTKSVSNLVIDNMLIQGWGSYDIPVYAPSISQMTAGEFELDLGPNLMIEGITSAQLDIDPSDIVITGSSAKAIWYDVNITKMSTDKPLFYLNVLANKTGDLKTLAKLGAVKATIYKNDKHLAGSKLGLSFNTISENTQVELSIAQSSNTVEFTLMNDRQVSQLALYDLSGTLILNQQNVNNSQAKINKNGFTDGLYLYHITTKTGDLKTGKIAIF